MILLSVSMEAHHMLIALIPLIIFPFIFKYGWKSLLFSVILTCFIGYFFEWIAMFLAFVISLVLAFLLVIGIIKIFKRNLNSKWHQIPLKMIVISIISIIITEIARPFEKVLPEESLSTSEQIIFLERTDQSDRIRLKTYFNEIVLRNMELPQRDSLRWERLDKLLAKGDSLSLEDKLNAAMIYQHGGDSSRYKKAYELSKFAFDNGLKSAEWLSQASFDRWQMSIGKEQKYGTQLYRKEK